MIDNENLKIFIEGLELFFYQNSALIISNGITIFIGMIAYRQANKYNLENGLLYNALSEIMTKINNMVTSIDIKLKQTREDIKYNHEELIRKVENSKTDNEVKEYLINEITASSTSLLNEVDHLIANPFDIFQGKSVVQPDSSLDLNKEKFE